MTSGSLFRSASHLRAVVAQFQVETAPRYQPRGGDTFCSTFAWDVSRAMGCELPKDVGVPRTCVDDHGDKSIVIAKAERTINEVIDWLRSVSAINLGWRSVDELGARALATQGKLALVVWKNPTGGHGHVAVVVPPPSDRDPNTWIAQAGGKCFSQGTLQSGFGNVTVEFFGHD